MSLFNNSRDNNSFCSFVQNDLSAKYIPNFDDKAIYI